MTQEKQFQNIKKQTKQFVEEMSPDEQSIIYNKGFKAGQDHSIPSPDTRNFMTKMETELINIKEKLEKMPTRDEMLLCVEKAIDTALEKSDKKFASKSTEKIVWAILGAVGFSFLGFIGWLVWRTTLMVGA